MSSMQYSNGIYEVKLTRYPKNRRYKVQLIKSPDVYHTHLRTLKEAVDLANYAKYQHLPNYSKVDYLYIYYRLMTSAVLQNEVYSKIRQKCTERGISLDRYPRRFDNRGKMI